MASKPTMDWSTYRRKGDPYGLRFFSPGSTDDLLACALMVTEKAKKPLGPPGIMGNLRHRGLQLFLGDEQPTMADASKVAAQEFASELSEEDTATAVMQLRKIPPYFLANLKEKGIISLEGSNIPETHTRTLYEKEMLHVVMRHEKGPWGDPYGLRLIIDCVIVTDEGDLEVYDWKGQNPFFKSNDVQALLNFLALAHPTRGLAVAWGLEPKKIRWTAIGIPSLIPDAHEFDCSKFDEYLAILDGILEHWEERRQKPEATPGKHCKDCSLNGTAKCPATANLGKPIEISAASRETVAGWSDADLVKAYQMLKEREGHIEAVMALVEPELKNRAAKKLIGPPGMAYKVNEQGNSEIRWDHRRAWALFCKAAGLEETWAIPKELEGVFGMIVGKGAATEWLKGRAGKDKALKDYYMDQLALCYDQGTHRVMKLVKCPENKGPAEDEPSKIEHQGVGCTIGPERCDQCSTAETLVYHSKDGINTTVPVVKDPKPVSQVELAKQELRDAAARRAAKPGA